MQPSARSAWSRSVALSGAVLLLAVSCGGEPDPPDPDDVVTTISEAEIGPGDAVPAPRDEVVLTVSGRIANTNVDDTLQFDLATLEQLRVVELDVDDQQAEGAEVTARGVLLADVLAVASAEPQAGQVMTLALNDYEYPIPISDAEDFAVVVATAIDGDRLTVERFGPLRIVYPNLAVDFDPTVYDARWTWQLHRLDIQ